MSILASVPCPAFPRTLFSLVAAGDADVGTSNRVILTGLLGALVVSVAVAAKVGVFRPRNVDGPPRVGPGRPLWPLAVALGAGLFVLFGTNVFYFAAKQVATMRPAPAVSRPAAASTTRSAAAELTLGDHVFLATVPGLMVFAVLLVIDRRLAGPLQLRLGFTARRFPDGVAKGLLGLVIVMPLMYAAELGLEIVYQRTGYRHPGEHMLLKLMGESPSPLLRWLLIGGALVTAPFSEEYMFRGFLQTLLRETFVRWSAAARLRAGAGQTVQPWGPAYGAGGALPVLAPPPPPDWAAARGGVPGAEPAAILALSSSADAGPTAGDFPGALPEAVAAAVPPPGARVWQTWAAIVITSLAFAAVHEPWTAPLIFLLSLFLGYAYERTGSLWTSITIHFLFNAISTMLYLWPYWR